MSTETLTLQKEKECLQIPYEEMQQAYMEQTEDLCTIKNTIMALLKKLGVLNEDGSYRENVGMKSIMEIAMKAAMNPNKLKEDFAFVYDLMPLVEKYKHL